MNTTTLSSILTRFCLLRISCVFVKDLIRFFPFWYKRVCINTEKNPQGKASMKGLASIACISHWQKPVQFFLNTGDSINKTCFVPSLIWSVSYLLSMSLIYRCTCSLEVVSMQAQDINIWWQTIFSLVILLWRIHAVDVAKSIGLFSMNQMVTFDPLFLFSFGF